jgi:hypothetical protein
MKPAAEMATSDESIANIPTNRNSPASVVSAGKFLSTVFAIANPISAIKRKVEKHYLNSRQAEIGIAHLDIENWNEIENYFKSLTTLQPDEILNSCPPTPSIKVNDGQPTDGGQQNSNLNPLRTFADYFKVESGSSPRLIVTRHINTSLVGSQLRIYVQRRREIMTGTGKRNPRNMMKDMVTKTKFAETDIKRMMLWSRLTQILPDLLVTGKTLFGWVFETSTAVTDKRVEDFLLTRTQQEKAASTTSVIADHIRFDRF